MYGVRCRMNSRDKFKAEWEAAQLRRKAELDLLEQVRIGWRY